MDQSTKPKERLAFNLQERFLLLFMTVTTSITIFIFAIINSHQEIPVFDVNDVLFEHQTSHGNIVISATPYNEFTLAFTDRNITGMVYASSTTTHFNSDTVYLTLPQTEDIPFSTYAIITANPALQEVILIENHSLIAHQARAKKTAHEEVSVFLIASSDLVGTDALIIGLNEHHHVIFEIQIP
ncbi:MAG: hypothetical protein FWE07_02030 [Turicibacter sp.]|nr:hypothetical protein [Turicibacter sp.]